MFEETPCDTEVGGSIYSYILYSGSSTLAAHIKRRYVPGCGCALHGNKPTSVWLVNGWRHTFVSTWEPPPVVLFILDRRCCRAPRAQETPYKTCFVKLPVAVSGRNNSYSLHGSGRNGCSAFGVASAVALWVVRVWFRQLCHQNPQPFTKYNCSYNCTVAIL